MKKIVIIKDGAMSDNKSWGGIGEEIRDAVEDALRSGNFKDLSDVVVNRVTDTVRDTVRTVSSRVGQAVNDAVGENQTEKYARATRERQQERARQEQAAREAAAAKYAVAPFRGVGKISGVLYRVFGGIGVGVTAIVCAVFLGLALGLGGGWRIAFLGVAALLLGFAAMLRLGIVQKARLKRAKKYLELSGHNQYVNLEDLALHTDRPRKFVLKDLKKMLRLGFFPEGHLDAKNSCLMLNDKLYREYLTLEKQRKLLEKEQRAAERKKEQEGPQKTVEPGEAESARSELDAMIAQGQDCIRRLRNMNDNIPGEEISAKLFRLENVLKEIFEGLKEHPEQLPQMKKFMNYYLPTTLKLVAAYEEFDDVSAQGEEIREAKTEIEKTLDTINSAFEELLNRMFRETAYDVTTDAQVLKTMLAKEGLAAEREFEKVLR
ncbi:MAG: 5-bromo-4-chloroindolyl phosphate hydrolysis family protein [bacterium]|nr:5-bromo-4-chloroindolyl phosphate hydrolysis family protein [bacterium]